MTAKKISLLTYAILTLVIAHVLLPLITPPGFFLDEAATGAHVVSMLQSWTNAHNVSWPLFSESLGGGYTTPIYLYPLTAWAAIFGTSELALRYFSVISTLLAIFVIGYVVKLWTNARVGLIAVTAGLVLPWGWLQGSLAWDPALVPLLVSAALLCFSLLLLKDSKRVRVFSLIGLPITLIGLAYLYPPMRVTAPLLFIAAYTILLGRHIIDIRGLFVTGLASFVVALPLALFMFQPEALERSQALSVFHDTSLVHGLWLAFINFLGLLNPLFLFVSGDPNPRHSTGFEGMLGVAAIPPLIALLVAAWQALRARASSLIPHDNTLLLIYIAVFGTLTSLLGSALTNEGQPHSLRATGAWIFLLILITFGWQILFSKKVRQSLRRASLAIALMATGAYIIDFAGTYPARSADAWDVPQRQAIYDQQPTPGYPELARRYYHIR